MASQRPSGTVAELAAMTGGEVVGRADLRVDDLAPLDRATPNCLSFIRSAEFAAQWHTSRAGAALVTRGIDVPGHDPATRALIIVPDADMALVALLEALAPKPRGGAGVHALAVVDPSATVHATASVGPGCVVGAGARLDAGAILIANVIVGENAAIGERSVLHPGVSVYANCVIGRNCTVHAGTVIGADGFGYRPDPAGGLRKIPHIGNVVLKDDVEIGANTCIDRAKFGSTVIGRGTKVDNLVQIGHNCIIGEHVVICGQAALSGSVSVGDGAMLGGSVGISDNVNIGAGAKVYARSGVMHDVANGKAVMGYPAVDARQFFRAHTHIQRMATQRKGADKGEA